MYLHNYKTTAFSAKPLLVSIENFIISEPATPYNYFFSALTDWSEILSFRSEAVSK